MAKYCRRACHRRMSVSLCRGPASGIGQGQHSQHHLPITPCVRCCSYASLLRISPHQPRSSHLRGSSAYNHPANIYIRIWSLCHIPVPANRVTPCRSARTRLLQLPWSSAGLGLYVPVLATYQCNQGHAPEVDNSILYFPGRRATVLAAKPSLAYRIPPGSPQVIRPLSGKQIRVPSPEQRIAAIALQNTKLLHTIHKAPKLISVIITHIEEENPPYTHPQLKDQHHDIIRISHAAAAITAYPVLPQVMILA